MADVSANLKDWSTTASSNAPADATTIGGGLADNLQEIQKVVRQDLANKGADIASGATTDLGAVAGVMHDITGTTTITSFGTVSAGIWKLLKFEGALTLTHNATSLILPNGGNITTADGDTALAMSEGSGNWRVHGYYGKNIWATNANLSGTLTVASTLTLSGTAANIALGSNYLSGDGGDEGVSVDSSGNVTATGTFTVSGSNGFAIGAVAGVARIQQTTNVFTLLTSGNATMMQFEADNIVGSGLGTLRVSQGLRIGTDSTNYLLDDATNGAGSSTLYIGNASINVTSDESVKENVRLWAGDASALLRGLPVKAWDRYLSDAPMGGYGGGYVGFTAQDLHKVAPWAVNTQGDTGLPWQARYEFLNGVIVKGWQEHDDSIESLLAWKSKAEAALAAKGIDVGA